MIAGLLEVADTVNGCPLSLAGPALMPVSVTVCRGASSLNVIGFGVSSVGRSLTGVTETVKVRVAVLFTAWPSLTITVTVAEPNAFGTGVKVNVPELPGLE